MKDLSRREAIASIAAGSAGLVLSVSSETKAQTVEAARAFRGQHQPRPLPFDPARLKGLSERLIRSHWENNYGGALKALGQVKARLAQAASDRELPPWAYNDLKREHLVRGGSVVLHEVYFDGLGGSGVAGAAERREIAAAFGSFDAWESEFRRMG